MAGNAAIFPGQGAQLVGMGRDVADQFSAAAETFREADRILGFEISKLCFDGPAERLNATDIQQPAIFVTSVALYRAGLQCGRFDESKFAAMGGLSLGEYTALHLAGALTFEDALRLVLQRGRLMQQAAEQRPGGMVSLLGMDEAAVLGLCEGVRASGRVAPANFNCPGQIVVSGELPGCEAVVQRAGEFGGKAVPLKVAGAFHSELMRTAADGLRPILAACAIRAPRIQVVANVDAAYHRDPESIRESLYLQIFNPVRWQGCVERLIADGCDSFWEIGPNRHLTGMMRKINRTAVTTNLSTAVDFSAPGQTGAGS